MNSDQTSPGSPDSLAWDLVIPSHAKINLGLHVLGKRQDGYHNIWTIFQELEFHDTLYFRKHREPLRITTDHPTLPVGDANLVSQAVRRIQTQTGCPLHVAIHIQKRIPLGAGLGGGSSNAAATLVGMNRLFRLGLGGEELRALAAELGSDVPFFLYGGTARATGRGEQLQPLPDLAPIWIGLIFPGIHISSGWAYKNINLKLTNLRAINSMLSRLTHIAITGRDRTPLHNMFEEPVIRQYPIIGSIKTALVQHGAEWAMLAGSGSTVFGVFRSKRLAEEALCRMERPDWVMVVTSIKPRTGCV
ncbi:4-(cytidine 5'-diphospho)-2-C-methyl-D-erythritol kinase [candidate division KSB3 bacterium]|uniref:4-diphosphocytidyl-2-C-methyl-D-erythritol kinase n=1 Tax=candidate division KSB3 bacterium TaxID=2044937 RepID=A0A9D5Q8G9_9BACT|nr:4-(cytidine 5'-diphospho)-2-C-methyl-D-erythritol kinase [candidate division KSB3 bacterium]MBD3327463.1 4-(cytidine 5'-diphospho)-2-C-methyl-D-erythritol kinase [candidate division KSB3 bacterium]